MTRIAVVWLVYRTTGSPLWLGVTAFAGQIPVLLGAPLSGWLLDRVCRRNVLLVTQALALIEACALVLLDRADLLTPWSMVGLACLKGWISAFDHPARQALLADLAEEAGHLTLAIAGDSLQANLARFVGPILAGLALAHFSEGACFLADGISYLVPLGVLLALRVPGSEIHRTQQGAHDSLLACARFVAREHRLQGPLVMLAVTSLVGVTFTVLLPQYTRVVLSSGPGGLSALICASSCGAIFAAMISIHIGKNNTTLNSINKYTICSGVLMIVFCFLKNEYAAAVSVFLLSFFIMLQVSLTGLLLQSASPTEMRGRMASLQSALFWGLMPFGSLLMGGLAQWIGPCGAYLVAGCCCIASGLSYRPPRRMPRTGENGRLDNTACFVWPR